MPSSKSLVMRNFKYYIMFTLLLVAASWVVIPRYYQVSMLKNAGPLFDDAVKMTYQHHILETQSDVILLGDSTLLDSIDETYLTELLGTQSYKIGNPGSASAIWYLILKNNIATSPVKPEQLVIFSRASMLTTPEYRTTGKYEESILEAALPEDALVIDRAYLSQMNELEKVFDKYLPLYGYRARIRKSIEDFMKYHISGRVMDFDYKQVDASFDDVFGDRELVQLSDMITESETYLHNEKRLDFDTQLPNSFLPEIVRICQENDIQLTFVYTQTIYTDQSEQTASMLADYRSDLFQYAAENNIQVLDYLNDERVQESFFNDPVHMNEYGRQAFTEIFAADFAEFLP